jgi:hypothetical protein
MTLQFNRPRTDLLNIHHALADEPTKCSVKCHAMWSKSEFNPQSKTKKALEQETD